MMNSMPKTIEGLPSINASHGAHMANESGGETPSSLGAGEGGSSGSSIGGEAATPSASSLTSPTHLTPLPSLPAPSLPPPPPTFHKFAATASSATLGGIVSSTGLQASFNKKHTVAGSSSNYEDLTTHHAHVDGEQMVELCPSGRYGKLNAILGKGAYKVVWKALDLEEGLEVAWNSFQTTKQESTELSQEIEILKRVRHPNIISFRDSWYNNGEFVFITELMTSGTLREYIQKLKTPNLKIVKRWARQILKGLCYLHSQSPPIIHRDIKCDNIFINGAHGEVKIGDMGTAKMKFGKKYTVIGTPEFMAPEMYEEKGYNEKVDVYAFGMCLLEMVTGEYPYSECKNAAQIYKKVSAGVRPECLSRVSDEAVLSLIHGCIAPEAERLSVNDAIEHVFFASEPELLLLAVDEARLILTLQVVFKGLDRLSVKFEFNLDTDTAEEVVNEMIEEKVLPDRYQTLITSDINRILREFHQRYPFAAAQLQLAQSQQSSLRRSIGLQGMAAGGPLSQSYDPTGLAIALSPTATAAATAQSSLTGAGGAAALATTTTSSSAPLPGSMSSVEPQLLQRLLPSTPSIPIPVSSAAGREHEAGTAVSSDPMPREHSVMHADLSTLHVPFSTSVMGIASPIGATSNLSWKRDIQYKAELMRAQRETELANERAREAEKKAKEMEALARSEEEKKRETEFLIESLRKELANVDISPTLLHQAALEKPHATESEPLAGMLVDTLFHSLTASSATPSYDGPLSGGGGGGTGGGGSSSSVVGEPITVSMLLSPGSTGPSSMSSSMIATNHGSTMTAATTPSSLDEVSLLTVRPELLQSDTPIDLLVNEVAALTHRGPDKANDWTQRLFAQDIMTVGDLKELYEEDWQSLNLTVFAARALKNAVLGRGSASSRPSTSTSSRASMSGGTLTGSTALASAQSTTPGSNSGRTMPLSMARSSASGPNALQAGGQTASHSVTGSMTSSVSGSGAGSVAGYGSPLSSLALSPNLTAHTAATSPLTVPIHVTPQPTGPVSAGFLPLAPGLSHSSEFSLGPPLRLNTTGIENPQTLSRSLSTSPTLLASIVPNERQQQSQSQPQSQSQSQSQSQEDNNGYHSPTYE